MLTPKSFLRAILFTTSAALFLGAPATRADVTVVSDSFSGTNGATLIGRTPDGVNLPGRTFSVAGSNGSFGEQPVIDTSAGNAAPSAHTGWNHTIFIDISSTGSYSKRTRLTMSMSLQMHSVSNDADASNVRGIGLGFFFPAPVDGNPSASSNFTGLAVRPDGSLHLVVAGTESGTAVVAPFANFLPESFYTLTYSVDTVTGSITSVSFNGNDYTATFSGAVSAGAFTNAVTNLAGFYGDTAGSASFFGRVDNFSIGETLKTFTVNTTGDAADAAPGDGVCEATPGSGDCTLRAAIQEARSGDTVNFSLPANSTITLTSSLPIAKDLTITGPGANVLTVTRSNSASAPTTRRTD